MSSLAAFVQAEARARLAEARIEDEAAQDASLASTINAVELYMKALILTENVADRKRIDGKCKELLLRAEKIKKTHQQAGTRQDAPSSNILRSSPISSRELSTREKIILLEGNKLNGFVFKAWNGPPELSEFVLNPGEDLFSDDHVLSLSELQLEFFAGWKRPQEALPSLVVADDKHDTVIPTMMSAAEKIDLVQDLTSDCSVVASLCAGTARAERGHGKVCVKASLVVRAEAC